MRKMKIGFQNADQGGMCRIQINIKQNFHHHHTVHIIESLVMWELRHHHIRFHFHFSSSFTTKIYIYSEFGNSSYNIYTHIQKRRA